MTDMADRHDEQRGQYMGGSGPVDGSRPMTCPYCDGLPCVFCLGSGTLTLADVDAIDAAIEWGHWLDGLSGRERLLLLPYDTRRDQITFFDPET